MVSKSKMKIQKADGQLVDAPKEVTMQFEYTAKHQHLIQDMAKSKAAERNKGRKIAAGVCFYNDYLSLRRCLESLQKDNVDLVFCVDGRFKQFGEAGKYPDLSDDGSRDLVLSYDNTILIDMPNSWEVQKRQAYIKACEDFGIDYLLINYLLIPIINLIHVGRVNMESAAIKQKVNFMLFKLDKKFLI